MNMRAPITPDKIHGLFRFEDADLSPDEEAELAQQIDRAVARDFGGSAVWFTEQDHREARARGVVLAVGGRTVQYVLDSDTLAFPNFESAPYMGRPNLDSDPHLAAA